MKYTAPSFTVPASGKSPENCAHGWVDARHRCVLCGERGPHLRKEQLVASIRAKMEPHRHEFLRAVVAGRAAE